MHSIGESKKSFWRFVREYRRWVKERLAQSGLGCGYENASGKGDRK
jgi:hypothetical protein